MKSLRALCRVSCCALCLLMATFPFAEPAFAKKRSASAQTASRTVAGSESLYERLGGERAVRDLVDDLVARVGANPRVNFFRDGKFAKTDVSRLKRHLADFIASAAGGGRKYTGRDMARAHSGMRINDDEFEALMADLAASLDGLKVPAKEKSELLRIVVSTKSAIVAK